MRDININNVIKPFFALCLLSLLTGCSSGGSSGQGATVPTSQTGTAPTAAFTFDPLTPVSGQATAFSDATTGSPTAWSWTFGDGTSSSIQNPSHTYSAAGTYTVTLSSSNPAGSDSVSNNVVVNPGRSPVTGLTFINSPVIGICPLFSDQYAFNQRVDDPVKYPVLANSAAIMKNIGMFGYTPMFTTVRPVPTTVYDGQPLLPLTCDPAFAWCLSSSLIANGTMAPYPQSLFIVSGADHHAFVIHETTGPPAAGLTPPEPLTPEDGGTNCYLYETWWTGRIVDNAVPSAQPVTAYTAGSNVTGFTAGGLSVYDLKRDKSYVPAGMAGSSASNLPVAAGQIRYDDFFNNPANTGHAIAVAFPLLRYSYITPANTSQLPYNCGANAYNVGGAAKAEDLKQFPCDFFNANLPAMGQRFRIKAGFDESPYANYPVTLKIIQWGKKWGFITTDGSPAGFMISGDSDPRWQQHMWPDIQQFRNIPVSAFEAVQSGPAVNMPMPGGVQNHPGCKVYDLSGSVASGC